MAGHMVQDGPIAVGQPAPCSTDNSIYESAAVDVTLHGMAQTVPADQAVACGATVLPQQHSADLSALAASSSRRQDLTGTAPKDSQSYAAASHIAADDATAASGQAYEEPAALPTSDGGRISHHPQSGLTARPARSARQRLEFSSPPGAQQPPGTVADLDAITCSTAAGISRPTVERKQMLEASQAAKLPSSENDDGAALSSIGRVLAKVTDVSAPSKAEHAGPQDSRGEAGPVERDNAKQQPQAASSALAASSLSLARAKQLLARSGRVHRHIASRSSSLSEEIVMQPRVSPEPTAQLTSQQAPPVKDPASANVDGQPGTAAKASRHAGGNANSHDTAVSALLPEGASCGQHESSAPASVLRAQATTLLQNAVNSTLEQGYTAEQPPAPSVGETPSDLSRIKGPCDAASGAERTKLAESNMGTLRLAASDAVKVASHLGQEAASPEISMKTGAPDGESLEQPQPIEEQQQRVDLAVSAASQPNLIGNSPAVGTSSPIEVADRQNTADSTENLAPPASRQHEKALFIHTNTVIDSTSQHLSQAAAAQVLMPPDLEPFLPQREQGCSKEDAETSPSAEGPKADKINEALQTAAHCHTSRPDCSASQAETPLHTPDNLHAAALQPSLAAKEEAGPTADTERPMDVASVSSAQVVMQQQHPANAPLVSTKAEHEDLLEAPMSAGEVAHHHAELADPPAAADEPVHEDTLDVPVTATDVVVLAAEVERLEAALEAEKRSAVRSVAEVAAARSELHALRAQNVEASELAEDTRAEVPQPLSIRCLARAIIAYLG